MPVAVKTCGVFRHHVGAVVRASRGSRDGVGPPGRSGAASRADRGTDLSHIRKNLRRPSVETTAIYLHVGERVRHREMTDAASKEVASAEPRWINFHHWNFH